MEVIIEQRLQDPQRVLILPMDEALMLGMPVMMGMISQNLIVGILAGFGLYTIWKKIKGDQGLEGFATLAYWYLPHQLGIFSSFPDSAEEVWVG